MPEFIPLHANIHFKCAFDVTAPNIAKLMTHLRKTFRSWCIDKIRSDDPILHRCWFFAGNNPKKEPPQYNIDGHQLRTVIVPGATADEPACWAFEMIHPDSKERARRWSVEIMLRKNEDNSVRFSTVVQNWMLQNYIGEYPDPPSASAPRYIRLLLNDVRLSCKKGDAILRSQTVRVSNKTCRSVYDQLMSDDRMIPFVLIAYYPERDCVLVTPRRLTDALIGNANIYVLPAQSVVDEMNYYLGDELRCEYGSIRVYQPEIDKTNPANAKSHRYLSTRFIDEHGEDSILRFLTNGIARNGSTFRLSDLTSFGDIFSERRKYTIQKLAVEGKGKQEEAAMVWEDNGRLVSEVRTWESTTQQLETEMADVKKQNSALKCQIDEANRVRQRLSDLESQCHGINTLNTLPANLSEILQTIAMLFPSRLEIHDRAIGSASEYSKENGGYWCKSENMKIAWKMVFSVATHLYDLLFVTRSNRIVTDYKTYDAKFDLALNEGKQTQKDNKLMNLRKVMHNGQELDIVSHVKYGNEKPKLLRLHYAVMAEQKKILIGHCGDHLDNYSTRKR